MPEIKDIVENIYGVFDKEVDLAPEVLEDFGRNLSKVVVDQLTPHKPRLRLSNLGSSCLRELWYSCNTPELAEKLQGHVRVKFLIGHITESVILFLARLAGYNVTDEQKEVDLHGVKGHLDANINNELVDCKSASPYGFAKFVDGLKPEADAFGYLTQLGAYGAAEGKKRGHFLAVDKVLGKLHLDSHDLPEVDYEARIKHVQEVLDKNEPPPRGFTDEPEGKSGNRKLGVKCSYCSFHETCWPGVQTFAYSNGPRFLTKVVRAPKVDRV